MSHQTISSRELIKRIKPFLSDTPIVNASMYLNMSDAATLTVEYMVTDELLKALSNVEPVAPSSEFNYDDYRRNQTNCMYLYILSMITKWPVLDVSNLPKDIFTHGYTLEICREPSVVESGDSFRKVIRGSDEDVYFLVNGKRLDHSDWRKHVLD